MIIDFTQLSQNQAYHTMTQTIVPRPVAWVLSEHANGKLNLAPFSYFSAVCSDPPLLMLSIGQKPDGDDKDTLRNIMERNKFVVHLAYPEVAHEVTTTARSLPAGESELELVGLKTEPFEGFALPRLEKARVAFGCELYKRDTIGNGGQNLVFGRIERLWIEDAITATDDKGRLKVLAEALDPLGRLGGSEYVTAGNILDIPRQA